MLFAKYERTFETPCISTTIHLPFGEKLYNIFPTLKTGLLLFFAFQALARLILAVNLYRITTRTFGGKNHQQS